MRSSLLGATLIWLLAVPVAHAHGIEAEVKSSARAVVVSCSYSNGEPANTEVLVYSPHEKGRIYQRLRTDIRGLASFVPDSEGRWRIVADDGFGHRTELEVAVQVEGDTVSASSADTSPWPSMRTMLQILAAIVMLAVWWNHRRRRGNDSEIR